jgi:hypothetical protein
MICDGCLHYSVWFLMTICVILYNLWWLSTLFCMISDDYIILYDLWWLSTLFYMISDDSALFCMICYGCLHYSVWFLMTVCIILYDLWWLSALFYDKFIYPVYALSNAMHKSRKSMHFRKLSIVRKTPFCSTCNLKDVWLLPIARCGRPEL